MAALARVGLPGLEMDRRVGELSGGEATALALAARLLTRPDVLLLDEPTNSLDRRGRERVRDLVGSWRGGSLLVVSHDRELLELVDRIGEVRAGSVTWHGGGWSAWRQAVDAEQAVARAALRAAESTERREARERQAAETQLARRRRYGEAMRERGRYPKIVANQRKREAQVSAGKLRAVHEDRLARARGEVEAAEAAIRDDPAIRVDLPRTAVPAGRDVLELRGVRLPFVGSGAADTPGAAVRTSSAAADTPGAPSAASGIDLLVRGPERIALTGANGTGKTTAVNVIVGALAPVAGTVRLAVPARVLPQRLDVLDDDVSVLANVQRLAPEATAHEIRAALARFQFRGRDPDRAAGALSGGERFRASLAAILLATPAPQLLILDEPTNSLDADSVDQLVSALDGFRGGLIAVSHDLPFLRACGVTRWLELADGALHEAPGEPG
jgi:ATPase subunit of ABC transporter with duplicated ATPase domains